MKIERLSSAQATGVFEAWRWPEGVAPFKRFNLVYGWNYSGKTTLSRLFRAVELGGAPEGFPSGHAVFATDEGDIQVPGAPHPRMRVFNGDFVEANISWGGEINPILLVGQRSIELEKELSLLRSELERIEGLRREDFTRREALETEASEALSQRAKLIKDTLALPGYTRTTLLKTLQGLVGSLESARVDESRLRALLAQHQQREDRGTHEVPDITVDTGALTHQVNQLLEFKVDAQPIVDLAADVGRNAWARQGMPLNRAGEQCVFCGGIVSNERWRALERHFSDSYALLEEAIRKARTAIANAQISWRPPGLAQVYQDLQPSYEVARRRAVECLERHQANLDALLLAVKRKEADPFAPPHELLAPFENPSEELGDCLDVLRMHNDRTRNLSKVREEAQDALVRHYAAEFAIEFSYEEAERKIKESQERHTQLGREATTLRGKIREREKEASDEAAGAEEINRYLASYFGKGDLRIVARDGDTFTLQRGDATASNLSEGEKTAISFAYFLTKLSESGFDRTNAVVLVDDPISSLDSRHLFNTFALVQNELADVGQLIVTTHSFEFFGLLRDWLDGERKGRNARFLMVERIGGDAKARARLADLPPVLRNFNSEYHYLFATLAQFDAQEGVDYELLYHLPNIARRFAEAFLGFKYPSKTGLRGKLAHLFPDAGQRARVDKFLNTYSHNRTAARSTSFPDLSECRTVVRMLLAAVEASDPQHVACLKAEIIPTEGEGEEVD